MCRVQSWKRLFPKTCINKIEETALIFEENIYGVATDKDDYKLKISERILIMETRARKFHSAVTARVLQQQMQRRQELLRQQQPPQQQQMQGRQELLPQQHMLQHQVMNQQPLQETILQGNLRPPHMQQHAQLPQQKQQLHHPTSFPCIQQASWHNNGEHQGAFTPSFRGMAQQNMHQQPLSFQCDNVSGFPSEQQQNIPFGESGNFDVYGSSLLGTQGQDFGQSQPMMYHPEQLQPQNRSLQPHLNENQRFQAAGGEEWQEEIYQKIKALKEKSLRSLSTILQNYVEKLRKVESLPQKKQKGIHKEIQSLRMAKTSLEQVIVFLNLPRSKVSKIHIEQYAQYGKQVLKWARNKTEPRNPIQQQQGRFPPSQIHQPALESQIPQVNMTQSLENDQIISQNQQLVHSDICLVQSFHHWSRQQQINSLLQIPEENQQLLMPTSHETNEMNDVRMRYGNNSRASLLQKCLSSSDHQLPTPLTSPARLLDQQILGGSSFVTPSPVTSFESFPVLGDPENTMSSVSHSQQSQTAAQEHPAFTLPPYQIEERPIDRLIRAVQSCSQETLKVSAREIHLVISLADRIQEPIQSSEEARARRKLRMQASRRVTTHEEPRMKRSITSQKNFSSLGSEGNSTESSGSKVNKNQACSALQQEIKEINGRLIETLVEICDEDDTSGTIVTCSYNPVLCANLKARYESGLISKIKPLRLLIPENYPYIYPVFLDNFHFDSSLFALEDLNSRTRSRFSLCSRQLSEPISLKDIAQMWDDCARATLVEYAARYGGGTC